MKKNSYYKVVETPIIYDIVKMPTICKVVKRMETSIGKNLKEVSEEYFFRGENNYWLFSSSSLWRTVNDIDKDIPEAFKRKVLVLIDSINRKSSTNENIINIMVKLRHEGIETPLIDLTTNFFVSLFFASLPVNNEEICVSESISRVKLFSRKRFAYNDYKSFRQDTLLKFWTGILVEDTPIIIKDIDWMHPNIRKQEGVLCFSPKGKIEECKEIIIQPEEKSMIIEELKSLNIGINTLFTGWEGISTSLLLDKTHSNNNIDPKDYMKILDVFDASIKKYNVGMIKLCTDFESHEKRMLFIKNTFREIYSLAEIPNPIRWILFLLEQEIFVNENRIEKKVIASLSSSKELPPSILKGHWESIVISMFDLNRIILADPSMLTLLTYLHLILDYKSWFNIDREPFFVSNKIAGKNTSHKMYFLVISQQDKLNPNSLLERLNKIEGSLQGIIENWLDYFKKNLYKHKYRGLYPRYDESPLIPLKNVHNIFLDILDRFKFNNEIFSFSEFKGTNNNLEVHNKANNIFKTFSIKLVVIVLFLWLNPNLSKSTNKFMNCIFNNVCEMFNSSSKDYDNFNNVCQKMRSEFLKDEYSCFTKLEIFPQEDKVEIRCINKFVKEWKITDFNCIENYEPENDA